MQANQNTSKRIPLCKLIAVNNTGAARKLVASYGLPAPETYMELEQMLNYILAEFGEDGLVEIVKIHPDRAIIEEVMKSKSGCGCGGGCGCSGGGNKADLQHNFITNYRYPAYLASGAQAALANPAMPDGQIASEPFYAREDRDKAAKEERNKQLWRTVGITSLLILAVVAINQHG